MQLLKGNFIWVHEPNGCFSNQSIMLLEHFDLPQYNDCVIVMLDYIRQPAQHFEQLYPGKKIIFYQLEQMMGCAKHWWDVETVIQNLQTAYAVWDYDKLNVSFMKEYGLDKDVKIVPMLYSHGLKKIENLENPEIDILFYGGYNERRYKIIEKISGALYGEANIVWIHGMLDKTLDNQIANSKIILNLHTYEPWNRQEQHRMFYPVINGKTVVSETSQLNNMEGCVIEVDTDDLPGMLKAILKNGLWRNYGNFARENFMRLTSNFISKL